ncbi:hypothetical protein MTBLM1_10022 [Rhodospirillaceae bacterium LM-1]|nr:hypothetical protein MTBLM1_10022 [Rhodospirillaceae bacterium LM-1]
MTRPLLAIAGVGRSDVEEIAVRNGYALTDNLENAFIVAAASPSREDMLRMMATEPPYALIETPVPQSAFGQRLSRALEMRGLYMSLSTATAFQVDLTSVLCSICSRRLPMSEERRYDIETAVDEALSNAMVHGNLDIASVLRNDPADFDLYCDLVNERLVTPLYATRRIEVLATWTPDSLDIEVHDEGRGYDISNFNTPPQLEAKCGRGFTLIRSLASNVTIAEHGRSLTMSFAP